MTRTEAIAIITSKLASADEATAITVAEFLSDAEQPIRDLTPRERVLVEQSKADFATGRTVSIDECMANADSELARRRAARGQHLPHRER
jgi:urease gamma subunit